MGGDTSAGEVVSHCCEGVRSVQRATRGQRLNHASRNLHPRTRKKNNGGKEEGRYRPTDGWNVEGEKGETMT